MGPWPLKECAMAISGIRYGHEWNRAMAISRAIYRGHISGAF